MNPGKIYFRDDNDDLICYHSFSGMILYTYADFIDTRGTKNQLKRYTQESEKEAKDSKKKISKC